jgi:putative RecB family exonuclease
MDMEATETILRVPTALSPSKISSFTNCALAFKYAYVDRLPQESTIEQVRGTLTHAALERFYRDLAPLGRTEEALLEHCLPEAMTEVLAGDEAQSLGLDAAQIEELRVEVAALARHALDLEDPSAVEVVDTEMKIETEVEGVPLRGIIDRLDRRSDGALIVVDYKTGKAPSERYEHGHLAGVTLYAAMCRAVTGELPAEVRLMHLREPMVLVAQVTERMVHGQVRRAAAVWKAIERACERDSFAPKVGPLCNWCSFSDRCPAVKGPAARH